ncbi:MAG TPA: YbjN domain-containing protein [Aliidongia sp.]|nr:YbjN domain-containing protein [Aliidongia sp.]
MTALSTETEIVATNPIDLVEEIVLANEWPHDRSSDEEMVVEISGRWCDYRLLFVWQEEISALHFSCSFDMKVPKARKPPVYELLATVNEKMWLGHFDICSDTGLPMFRHAVLLRGAMGASVEQIEDLVDMALTECERFYPAFQFVIWGGKTAEEAVISAMIEPVGEA